MTQNSSQPELQDRFTELLDRAVRNDRDAREKLFRQIEPRARQVAGRVIDQQGAANRLSVTAVIGHVFEDLILPSEREAQSWRNRAYFFACVGRRTMQIVVDLLRAERGVRDRESVVSIIHSALENETVKDRLGRTRGDVSEMAAVLSDLIASPDVSRRIMKERGDPSNVIRAVRSLLGKEWTAAFIQEHGGSEQPYGAIVSWLQEDRVRRSLALIRRPTGPPADDVQEDAPNLTIHSLLTAHEAIEEMDDYFADDTAPPVAPPLVPGVPGASPLNTELEPQIPVTPLRPRSLNGRIVYLRMIGWTWQEIADGLGRPLPTVYSRAKSALEHLKDSLKGDFGLVDRAYALSPFQTAG